MRSVISILVLLGTMPAFAQPRVTNGDVHQAAAPTPFTRASLDALATETGTAWLAYAVPLVDGDRWICDGISDGRSMGAQLNTTMMLEGPRRLWVLYRLDAGGVDRIRIASENCTLDAGGLPLHWLPSVSPAESVSVLASFLTDAASRRVADGALTALAMHRDPAALERLLTAARDGATTHLRGQALFWLSQRAGEKAIGAISSAITNDPETEVKRRAVFALSQLPKDEGVPRLIDVARSNPNPAVRKQAMFWLGQSRDPRAVKFFAEILFK